MTDILDRADRFQSALPVTPYKTTPVFDEQSLPAGLRRTEVGVWGVIRVLEGHLRYVVPDPQPSTCSNPVALVSEPIGPMGMQVDFPDQLPF